MGAWGSWPFAHWFAWILGAIAAEAASGALQLPRWCLRPRAALAFAAIALFLTPEVFEHLVSGCGLYSLSEEHLVRRVVLGLPQFKLPLFAVACFIWLNCWVRSERAGEFR